MMHRNGPTPRRRLALLALAAASALGALVCLELAVRTVLPEWAPRSARLTAFWQHDARYGWTHVPGQVGRFRSVGFDVAVRTNARGFRGPDIAHTRDEAGTRRLLLLGDSHVWGFGVEEDETFGRQLEAGLPALQVVNLGVSGYSTDQELLLYQTEGYRYAADLVLLMVAHNDLWANTRTVESSVYGKPRFLADGDRLVLDNVPVPRPSWIKRTVFNLSARSYLLTRALRVIDEGRRSMTTTAAAPAADAPLPQPRTGRFPRGRADTMTVRLIEELQRSVHRLQPSARFLVVFADLRNGLGSEAVAHLAKSGVQAIALDGVIDPLDPAWHLPDRLHWTADGHRKVAAFLADHISQLLPPPVAPR